MGYLLIKPTAKYALMGAKACISIYDFTDMSAEDFEDMIDAIESAHAKILAKEIPDDTVISLDDDLSLEENLYGIGDASSLEEIADGIPEEDDESAYVVQLFGRPMRVYSSVQLWKMFHASQKQAG